MPYDFSGPMPEVAIYASEAPIPQPFMALFYEPAPTEKDPARVNVWQVVTYGATAVEARAKLTGWWGSEREKQDAKAAAIEARALARSKKKEAA